MAVSPTTAGTNTEALGLLIYDGDCGFCSKTARKFVDLANGSAVATAWQRLDPTDYGLTEADCDSAAYWVQDGVAHRGAYAFAHGLQVCEGPLRSVGKLLAIPPFIWLARAGYPLLAKFRHRLPGATDSCRI